MLKISYLKITLYSLFALVLLINSSFAADTAKGEGLYNLHCSDCHGTSGVSIMPDAPNFAQNESLMQGDNNLLIFIRNGKNAMPAYQGILKDQDILDVIAYLRTLN